jgi:hypothetical protein
MVWQKTEKPHHTKNKRTIYPTPQTAALKSAERKKSQEEGARGGDLREKGETRFYCSAN